MSFMYLCLNLCYATSVTYLRSVYFSRVNLLFNCLENPLELFRYDKRNETVLQFHLFLSTNQSPTYSTVQRVQLLLFIRLVCEKDGYELLLLRLLFILVLLV